MVLVKYRSRDSREESRTKGVWFALRLPAKVRNHGERIRLLSPRERKRESANSKTSNLKDIVVEQQDRYFEIETSTGRFCLASIASSLRRRRERDLIAEEAKRKR